MRHDEHGYGKSYTDIGLVPGYTYAYGVSAYDAAGNVSNSTGIHATTLSDIYPPSAPPSIVAMAKSSTAIDVSWQPANDNVRRRGNYVYRNGSQVATVSSTILSYLDTGLAAATSYGYTVAAYDAAGNVSPQSYAATASTMYPDMMPPSVPFGFTATPVSPSAIALAWDAAFDNVGVAGYAVIGMGQRLRRPLRLRIPTPACIRHAVQLCRFGV